MFNDFSICPDFTYREFIQTSIDNGTLSNHRYLRDSPELINNLSILVGFLQTIRDVFGVVNVHSGVRCTRVNRAVCGVHNSYHLKSLACDIDYNPQLIPLFNYLRSVGILKEFICKSGYIHIAIDKDNIIPLVRVESFMLMNYINRCRKSLLDFTNSSEFILNR